jgi:HlyD family secretion protein
MKHRVIFFAIFCFLLAIAFSFCSKEKQRENIITASGTIEATEIYLRTEANGQIVRFELEEGDRIDKGDIICQQDHQKLDHQLTLAEAQIEEIKARLRLLRKGAREEEIERAKASLDAAMSTMAEAEREFRRIEQLVAEKARPSAMLERAETSLELSRRKYDIAQKEYEIVKLGSRKEQIEAAEAQLKQAIAQMNLIKSQIEDAAILSPIEGVLTEKIAEEGEFLPAGSLVAKITNLNDIWMKIYLSEKDFGKVRLHDNVKISIDSFPGKKFDAHITYLSPEAEFTPKNIQTKEERVKLVFAVKVTIDNPQGYLKPGLPADAEIILSQE